MNSFDVGPRRWVIKIGSSLLTDHGLGLDAKAMGDWARQIVALQQQGHEVVVVSSGAVAEGIRRLGISRRPEVLAELQATAAVGQMGLIEVWGACFAPYGVRTAQILLTHEDVASRNRYLNARTTLTTLLRWGVVPIVNENDTVATDEIRLGDNDTLGALVTNLIGADLLVILTDQVGLLTSDPREDPNAQLVREGVAGDPALEVMAGGAGSLGRGGMMTKVAAAKRAARSGAHTVIAAGGQANVLLRLAQGASLGTFLRATVPPLTAHQQWLADQLQVQGQLILDGDVVSRLRQGEALYPIQIIAVQGVFERGALVQCLDGHGVEWARGLVNYGSAEVTLMLGQSDGTLLGVLGYQGEPELIHQDHLLVWFGSSISQVSG